MRGGLTSGCLSVGHVYVILSSILDILPLFLWHSNLFLLLCLHGLSTYPLCPSTLMFHLGASQLWTKPTKTMSQTNFSLNCGHQVFFYYGRKVTNTKTNQGPDIFGFSSPAVLCHIFPTISPTFE